jgi:hypothetical protein
MGGLPEPIRVRHPSTDRTAVLERIGRKKKNEKGKRKMRKRTPQKFVRVF